MDEHCVLNCLSDQCGAAASAKREVIHALQNAQLDVEARVELEAHVVLITLQSLQRHCHCTSLLHLLYS